MRNEMRSPIGKRELLQKVILEYGLVAFQCPESGGCYITLDDYWRWLKKQPEHLANLPALELGKCVVEDEAQAKLCPETGTIMMRCKVGNDFDFYIDRSKAGGIWLDAGEWEALKNRNFHDELHLIITDPWQDKIRAHQAKKLNDEMLLEKLGGDLLKEINELKAKLENHPNQAYAIAHLESGLT